MNLESNSNVRATLMEQLGVSPLVASILEDKGLATKKEAGAFLFPKLETLPNPFLMKDMEKAVGLCVDTIIHTKPIVIYGDYDVDGTTATALLYGFFKEVGIEPVCFQPNRLTDGYGLTQSNIEFLAAQRSSKAPALFITVDCGITSMQEVKFAQELGYQVIVTDHHEPQETIPNAEAVLNPRQNDCEFPFKFLAGVGVAFYLVAGIRNRLNEMNFWAAGEEPNLKKFLDLVALGTVADIMPLIEVNRVLVKAGLEVISGPNVRKGIKALAEKSNLSLSEITSEDISYRVAPRLNAAGRLGEAEIALELLTATTTSEASFHAEIIEEKNYKRKKLVDESFHEVNRDCAAQLENGASFLVHYGNHHPGVIGILAAKIVDIYNRPCLVFTDDIVENIIKGSARSVGNFDLLETVRQCSEYLIGYGGHKAALGLKLRKGNLESFKVSLNSGSSIDWKKIRSQAQVSTKRYNYILLSNPQDFDMLRLFEPFGLENEEPLFECKQINPRNVKIIKHEHLKFEVNKHGHPGFEAIAFNMAHKREILNGPVDLLVKFRRNTFRGKAKWQMQIYDISPASC